jgi:hypothetical protein
MNILKSALLKGALVAAVAGGAVTAATTASAEVACNRFGECWHVRDRMDYPARAGIIIHSDDWRFRGYRHDRYRWRHDHDDRGYYRNGVWISF